MNAKGRIYMKSLLAKLSAMRVTLSVEEQVLLDQMILGSQAEVGAHRAIRRADESLAGGPDEVAAHMVAREADEVATHRMPLGADEVAAHRMPLGAEEAAQRIVIYYDPELEAYQIKD